MADLFKVLLSSCLLLQLSNAGAQLTDSFPSPIRKKNLVNFVLYKKPGADSMVDFRDVFRYVFPKKNQSAENQPSANRTQISFVPAILYGVTNGLTLSLNANASFRAASTNQNYSNILTNINYTQYKQVIAQIATNIWSKNNAYNFQTNWSYLKYPQQDFGLGGNSSLDRFDQLDYSYLRLYQSVLKKLAPDFYVGPGLNVDYHWNIKDTSTMNRPVFGAREYGVGSRSNSTGLVLNLLYDTRKNIANPVFGSSLIQLIYRNNLTWLGSDQHTQTLQMDLRKYVRFPANSRNTLAFWSYTWLTLQGNLPYLDLPATGWDAFGSSGRGYIQGRFRGKQMLYAESEYRFGITENGLIGGVVFANAQSFSETPSGKINTIAPGYGLGLRIKFNKHSNTNVGIDYGFGKGGSRGLFMNLGEVF